MIFILVDGVIVANGTTAVFSSSPSNTFRIGGYGPSAWQYYIQDLRFTTGVARYTTTYSRPVGMLPNPPQDVTPAYDPFWALTPLYMPLDATPFTDVAGGHQVAAYGSPSLVSGALSCAGTSGLIVQSLNDLNIFASDFTIELMVNPSSFPTTGINLISKRNGQSSYGAFFIGCQSGSTSLGFNLSSNGTSWDIANNAPFGTWSIGAWQHIALVRKGTVITPYLNGVPGTAVTTSSVVPLVTNSRPVCIGIDSDGEDGYGGLIAKARITKGARYQGKFTPPPYQFATSN
jgi:hypothetical protein